MPHARIQQPQVIVDFSRGGNGRPRIPRRILLPDRNGRCDSSDFVNVRLLDSLQKLPRVSRKRFDVPALALGIQRVKRQARLSRARNAGNYGDGVVGNREIEIFQIVDSSAADADLFDITRNCGSRRRYRCFRFTTERFCECRLVCRVLRHACKHTIIRRPVNCGKRAEIRVVSQFEEGLRRATS